MPSNVQDRLEILAKQEADIQFNIAFYLAK